MTPLSSLHSPPDSVLGDSKYGSGVGKVGGVA